MNLPDGFELIKPPLGFQKEGIIYGMIHPNPGILFGTGLGKTMVAINIARYRMQFFGVDKVLVISPTSILHKWAKEIKKFSEYEPIVLHDPQRLERIYRIKHFREDPILRFGLINYEALHRFIYHLLKININMTIAD